MAWSNERKNKLFVRFQHCSLSRFRVPTRFLPAHIFLGGSRWSFAGDVTEAEPVPEDCAPLSAFHGAGDWVAPCLPSSEQTHTRLLSVG